MVNAHANMIWLLVHPLPLSPVSKLDRRHTGRLRKRDNFLKGQGTRGWARRRIIRRKKSWSSINYTILTVSPIKIIVKNNWKKFRLHILPPHFFCATYILIKEVLRRENQGLNVYLVDGSPVFNMTGTYFWFFLSMIRMNFKKNARGRYALLLSLLLCKVTTSRFRILRLRAGGRTGDSDL